ncbi:Proteasome subunit beta type-4 [Zancudomyces culisetae]|uniref:Proteasome subunit beta n=1 Tax=Zancudomyces culisetae TaxID=1213189 RepID=A0A1R1PM50_ZANCU|nr:Proteasome subunit beta type-4 [Zancudomyces culisetae]|eukprot:OMH82027.1 Proteasome subunit beta type-4 [Zancudomyces culisetae]
MLAADCLASYGSLARFRNVQRIHPAGPSTLIAGSGDISDFQYVQRELDQLLEREHAIDDGQFIGAKSIYRFVSSLMYARRSKVNPLWNKFIIAGYEQSGENPSGSTAGDGKQGEAFLGFVDLYGTTFVDNVMATGYGAHLALPILRKHVEGDLSSQENQDVDHQERQRQKYMALTEQQASEILDTCMRVLFYRDARSLNKIQKAKITTSGYEITEPYSLDTNWDFAEHIIGYSQ